MDVMGTPGEGLGRCSHALIRGVPESLASGEGAGAGLPALDLAKAQREHGVLGGKLRQRLGLQLLELPPEESLPLGPLLGDTAVIQGDTALITRPWSPARRPEVRARVPLLLEDRIARGRVEEGRGEEALGLVGNRE